MIDLHCHSNFSDGELSPSELLKKAIDYSVRILALTDHDTIDGLAPLHHAACDADIKIISGIELSVRWKKYDIHIIGLNITPNDPALCTLIAQQNTRRIARAHKIAECLLKCGVQDAFLKASVIAGHQRIGRPHFAQVLINDSLVQDMNTAFKRYLGRGKAAYVPTQWISIDEAVAGIVQAGGQAVIAHPLKYGLTRSKLHELIIAFKTVGGVGMEVISGETTVTEANELAGLCLRFELLASTGSDYHGNSSRMLLGQQRTLPVNCTPIWDKWDI